MKVRRKIQKIQIRQHSWFRRLRGCHPPQRTNFVVDVVLLGIVHVDDGGSFLDCFFFVWTRQLYLWFVFICIFVGAPSTKEMLCRAATRNPRANRVACRTCPKTHVVIAIMLINYAHNVRTRVNCVTSCHHHRKKQVTTRYLIFYTNVTKVY